MEMEVLELNGMQYIKTYTQGYESGKKYPVIIFLHGAGTRGTDIELLKGNSFFKMINRDYPFMLIAPQCHKNTWFDHMEDLKKLVSTLAEDEFVDEKRIYLMGNSMGGYGTWQLAMSIPEMFAAIVPICGGGMYWNAARLADVPVWAFHGQRDKAVFVEESHKMVDAVNAKGGNAKITIYPELGHRSWDPTYSNPEVMEWLLSNENHGKVELNDEYTDTKLHG